MGNTSDNIGKSLRYFLLSDDNGYFFQLGNRELANVGVADQVGTLLRDIRAEGYFCVLTLNPSTPRAFPNQDRWRCRRKYSGGAQVAC